MLWRKKNLAKQGTEPAPTSPQPIAIPTELSWLLKNWEEFIKIFIKKFIGY
jgi:hypothetical protein